MLFLGFNFGREA